MSGEQKKIIAVDDNVEILTNIKNILKAEYDVYPFTDGFKMMEFLEKITPDLFLLDIEMPIITGYGIAKILKNEDKFREIPIVFLTSLSDEENEIQGLDIGAIDYIHKPFSAPLLLKRIQTHLSTTDRQKELLEAQSLSNAMNKFLSQKGKELRNPLDKLALDTVLRGEQRKETN
jgi:putative two-component system response regulator